MLDRVFTPHRMHKNLSPFFSKHQWRAASGDCTLDFCNFYKKELLHILQMLLNKVALAYSTMQNI